MCDSIIPDYICSLKTFQLKNVVEQLVISNNIIWLWVIKYMFS